MKGLKLCSSKLWDITVACRGVHASLCARMLPMRAMKGMKAMKAMKGMKAMSAMKAMKAMKEQWIFPVPGILEGVKSRGKTILKMQHVDFKYPTHEKNTVEDITLTVCMGSRVAVVGANGAGKSTAIKLLIGELKPIQGTIWRHQNMRLAHVRRQSPWQSPDRPRQSPRQSRSP